MKILNKRRNQIMEKGKFNRAAFDPTQLQQFVDEMIAGGAGGSEYEFDVAEGGEPSQEDLANIYETVPSMLKVNLTENGSYVKAYIINDMKADNARLYYATAIENDRIEIYKIEYSEDDGYIFEPYFFSLTDKERYVYVSSLSSISSNDMLKLMALDENGNETGVYCMTEILSIDTQYNFARCKKIETLKGYGNSYGKQTVMFVETIAFDDDYFTATGMSIDSDFSITDDDNIKVHVYKKVDEE